MLLFLLPPLDDDDRLPLLDDLEAFVDVAGATDGCVSVSIVLSFFFSSSSSSFVVVVVVFVGDGGGDGDDGRAVTGGALTRTTVSRVIRRAEPFCRVSRMVR